MDITITDRFAMWIATRPLYRLERTPLWPIASRLLDWAFSRR